MRCLECALLPEYLEGALEAKVLGLLQDRLFVKVQNIRPLNTNPSNNAELFFLILLRVKLILRIRDP